MRKTGTKTGICIAVLTGALLIAVFTWDDFLSGLRFRSPDRCIASIYLVLLICISTALLLSRAKSPGGGRFRNTISGFFARMAEKKISTISMTVLFLIFSAALLAPLISPSGPNDQPDTLVLRYLPPLSHAYILSKGDGSFIYANEVRDEGDRITYRRAESWEMIKKGSLSGSDARGWAESWKKKIHFILGTDKFGRDILSRIIYGSRISLAIGILAVLISAVVGIVVGSVSGFFGSFLDSFLMRLVDIMLSFPRIFLILLIVALFKPSLCVTIAVLSATGWMGISRLVRGQTLSLREVDFVKAARAMGQKNSAIILKHLLPNTSSTIIIDSTLRIGNTILIEASLSFLGLGVQPPTASWGSIISDGRDALLDGWWISTFPGIALVLTVVAFNLVGDLIRDFLSPRSTSP